MQVIVENEQLLTSVQLSCDGSEGSVLPQTEEEGLQGVTLFAPFALWNVVHNPQLILPQELGWMCDLLFAKSLGRHYHV